MLYPHPTSEPSIMKQIELIKALRFTLSINNIITKHSFHLKRPIIFLIAI